jgi:hypothetical protein
MNKKMVSTKRVLARRLARELTIEELNAATGMGTSYGGTMCNAQGLGLDVEGRDSVNGGDTYAC